MHFSTSHILLLAAVLLGPVHGLGHASPPMSLLILPPANLSGDTNAACWSVSVPQFLSRQLQGLRSVRVVPNSSVEFALRDLALGPGQILTAQQMKSLGQAVEARSVIWGSYHHTNGEWTLTMTIMKSSNGKCLPTITAAAPDWPHVLSGVLGPLLRQLGAETRPGDVQRISQPITKSALALESLSRAYLRMSEEARVSDVVALLQEATTIDENFALAHDNLAYLLMVEGKNDDALAASKRAVRLAPTSAHAHCTLATIYLFLGLSNLAYDELAEAIRLDPAASNSYFRLGEAYSGQSRWREAGEALKRAEKLEPCDPTTHAELGFVLQHLGDRQGAFKELALAERYDTRIDPALEHALAPTYQLLGDTSKAVQHYERFLSLARGRGLQNKQMEEAQTELAELKARLTPTPVKIHIPATLATATLDKMLRSRLTPDEYIKVVNPIQCSPAMRQWAERVTAAAESPNDKARELLKRLTLNIRYDENAPKRTAEQAFEEQSKSTPGMSCQDSAFLYVALVRSIGIDACSVYVRKDYYGDAVSHVCAAVSLLGTNYLVDPSCDWFGVPHQEFQPLDDVAAIAVFLTESHDFEKEEIGLKLVPDLAPPHLWVATDRAHRGDCKGARHALTDGLALDSESWLAQYALGCAECCDGDGKDALKHFRASLELKPDCSVAHFFIGTLLAREGSLKQAREEYRAYLAGGSEPNLASQARQAIAYINETVADDSADNTGR